MRIRGYEEFALSETKNEKFEGKHLMGNRRSGSEVVDRRSKWEIQ